jgi:hypothetical protein
MKKMDPSVDTSNPVTEDSEIIEQMIQLSKKRSIKDETIKKEIIQKEDESY